MSKRENISISEVLRKVGKPVAYYPEIARALGSVKCGIFLCQFMYWEGRQADPEGWIYKTMVEIESETGLSRFEQESARKTLTEMQIMEQKKKGMPAKLYYRFIWDRLDEILEERLQPKKKKAATKPEIKQEPILYRMMVAFELLYKKQTGEDFVRGVNKKLAGKNWENIRKLKEIIVDRHKKLMEEKKVLNANITDDQIMVSWELFLNSLNAFHLKSWLDPALLVSNYNVIRNDIRSNKPAANGQAQVYTLPS